MNARQPISNVSLSAGSRGLRSRLVLWAIALSGVVGCASELTGDPAASRSSEPPGTAGTADDASEDAAVPDGARPRGGADAGTSADAAVTSPPPPGAPLAAGVQIAEVAIFQTVKVSLAQGATKVAARNAPVVAGKDALVRAYVRTDGSYRGQQVTGDLRVKSAGGETAYLDKKVAAAASAEGDLATTFNFQVPGAVLTPDAEFTVAITDPGAPPGEGNPLARYPGGGARDSFGAEAVGPVKVVLVPVRYDAAGGLLPDTGAAQVQRYRDTLQALYPTSRVDITVHAPFPYSSVVSGNGTGFGNLLQAIINLRASERPAKDVYYYGIFVNATSFSQYCGGGCVTGLSSVSASPSDATSRASVGHGFPGAESAQTAAHEIGHAHGRQHAPCGGAASTDPSYPYTGASIGVWGYSTLTKQLIDPSRTTDLMGYCRPAWISDYNYRQIFARMKSVNTADFLSMGDVRYRMVSVAPDGTATWSDAVTLDAEPGGEERAVDLVSEGGQTSQVRGYFYPYDHLPGGWMLVPQGAWSVERTRLNRIRLAP